MGLLSWLVGRSNVPRLRPGRGFTFDIAGEGSYQAQLSSVCGGKTPDGHKFLCEARLVLEAGNKHDVNAVRVDIGGKPVGYLARSHAVEYRQRISAPKAECQAKIVGGWKIDRYDEGDFGVKLSLKWPPEITE